MTYRQRMEISAVIKSLGGPASVAGKLPGVKPNTVAQWASRNTVPARYWHAFVKIPGVKKAGITIDTLSQR